MRKFNKINFIFMMILLAVEMFALNMVIFTNKKIYCVISCIIYVIMAINTLVMWYVCKHKGDRIEEQE